ncbi:MAG: hypothetical protein K0U98_06590 [Deltaproteobacteria bacterium]|nr:hypothetical protein [Deltaproteobacteria bacterium]
MKLVQKRARPYSLQDMLDIFECRVEVWQLGPAANLLKELEKRKPGGTSAWAHSAYSLIAMLLFYFEMIGKTLNSRSPKPSLDFNHGFCDVYPKFNPECKKPTDHNLPAVKAFRDRLRNGLYHLGHTKQGLFIHNEPRSVYPEDFSVDEKEIPAKFMVNPHSMARTIIGHFPGFMSRLRDENTELDDLRSQFKRFFKDFHRGS